MDYPTAVLEKAKRLEQLLQRVAAGEPLDEVNEALGLNLDEKQLVRAQAKYEAGGCRWEALIDGRYGHAPNSFHLKWNGAKAGDFHFKTEEDPRQQYLWVERMAWPAFGVYYDWKWGGEPLSIGFHVDMRPYDRLQRWTRRNGKYALWLGRDN